MWARWRVGKKYLCTMNSVNADFTELVFPERKNLAARREKRTWYKICHQVYDTKFEYALLWYVSSGMVLRYMLSVKKNKVKL